MFEKSLKLFMALRVAKKSLGIDIYKMAGCTDEDAMKRWRQGVEILIRPEMNTKELALFLSQEFVSEVAEDLIKRRRAEHQIKSWVEDGKISVSAAKEFFRKSNLATPSEKPLKTTEDYFHPLI